MGDEREVVFRFTDHTSPITHHGGRMAASILIVDDEEPIRAMTQALLERLGLKVKVTRVGSIVSDHDFGVL